MLNLTDKQLEIFKHRGDKINLQKCGINTYLRYRFTHYITAIRAPRIYGSYWPDFVDYIRTLASLDDAARVIGELVEIFFSEIDSRLKKTSTAITYVELKKRLLRFAPGCEKCSITQIINKIRSDHNGQIDLYYIIGMAFIGVRESRRAN